MSKATSPVGQGAEELNLPNSPLSLGMGIFWLCAAVAALLPLLPVYVMGLGVSASGFAFLSGLQQLAALLVSQTVGYIADTRMRRTTMLVIMGGGGIVMAALFPLIPGNMLWLSVGMVGLAFFFGQRQSLFNALALDSRRGEELYSRIRGFGSIGFVLFAPIVGWLADRFTTVVIWPCLAVIELAFVASILCLKDAPASQRMARSTTKLSFARAQRLLLSNRLLCWFLLYTFILQSVHLPGHFYQLMLLKELKATSLFITLSVTWAALCEIAVFYHGPRIIARFDLMKLLAVVPLALAVRFTLIFLFADAPWVILASNTLHMFTFGLAYLCSVIFVNRLVPRELKSSGQAILNMTFSMISALTGNLLAAWVLRELAVHWGMEDRHALMFWFGMAAVWALMAYAVMVPMKRLYRAGQRDSGLPMASGEWRMAKGASGTGGGGLE